MTGNSILDSALVLGSVGLFFGFLIAMVNKKFQVWEDPRIDDVEELLPSTNCGACGQPGCRAFAEAVVAGTEQPSGCTVMGDEDTRKETRQGLVSAKNFLRKTIGRDLKIRQAPDLRFVYDDSLDRAMRIENAIGRIRNESDADTETVDNPDDGSDVAKDADDADAGPEDE